MTSSIAHIPYGSIPYVQHRRIPKPSFGEIINPVNPSAYSKNAQKYLKDSILSIPQKLGSGTLLYVNPIPVNPVALFRAQSQPVSAEALVEGRVDGGVPAPSDWPSLEEVKKAYAKKYSCGNEPPRGASWLVIFNDVFVVVSLDSRVYPPTAF